jgi:hypothetical protein
MKLVQGRAQWRALVLVVVNRWVFVPKNMSVISTNTKL